MQSDNLTAYFVLLTYCIRNHVKPINELLSMNIREVRQLESRIDREYLENRKAIMRVIKLLEDIETKDHKPTKEIPLLGTNAPMGVSTIRKTKQTH